MQCSGPVLADLSRRSFDRLIEAINASAARVLAVDTPSGLDCDTGEPLGPTVQAEHTVTFVAAKAGFTKPAAAKWLGGLHVVGIGAPRLLRNTELIRRTKNVIMDALAFLERASKSKPQPIYALSGDEAFLKRQVLAVLQPLLLDDADPAFAWSSTPGDQAVWSTIRGELETLPFLSPRRVMVVEAADGFVTQFRPRWRNMRQRLRRAACSCWKSNVAVEHQAGQARPRSRDNRLQNSPIECHCQMVCPSSEK